jgi:hypothetical protein
VVVAAGTGEVGWAVRGPRVVVGGRDGEWVGRCGGRGRWGGRDGEVGWAGMDGPEVRRERGWPGRTGTGAGGPGRLRAESCSPEVTPRTDASGPV